MNKSTFVCLDYRQEVTRMVVKMPWDPTSSANTRSNRKMLLLFYVGPQHAEYGRTHKVTQKVGPCLSLSTTSLRIFVQLDIYSS